MKQSHDSSLRVKVAYLIDTIASDTAGTQKQLLEIIHRLDINRFEPCLICLWQSDWMMQNDLPCPCYVLGYKGFIKWSFPGVIKRLVEIIEERQLDIIQTFFEDSIFVGFLAKLFTRRNLVLLSSRRDIGLGKANQPTYHKLYTFILPWVNRGFDGIVANCEQVKCYVAKREKTNPAKIKVINNGVLVPDRPVSVPGILHESDGIVWIGILASLTPVKRHDLLIKAAAVMRDRKVYQNYRILLLGEGPEYRKLRTMVNEYSLQEFIFFAGAVKDVPSYLYNIDIGVLCSDREGLSNAVLEYMSCGLPVVVTSVGGNSELVDDHNGICIPPGDHTALAEALQQLVIDEKLRMKLGKASYRKIRRSYSWSKAMVDLEDYYLSLLGSES